MILATINVKQDFKNKRVVLRWSGFLPKECGGFGCAIKEEALLSSLTAGVAKLVYAPDSKSGEVKLMSVRVRPPAPHLC
jgi:hypothetical protein